MSSTTPNPYLRYVSADEPLQGPGSSTPASHSRPGQRGTSSTTRKRRPRRSAPTTNPNAGPVAPSAASRPTAPKSTFRSRKRTAQLPSAEEELNQPRHEATFKGRLRRYLPTVLLPLGVVLATILVLALAGLMLTGTSLRALPATMAHLWLIINLVPITIPGGMHIGILPLAPALIMVAVLARRINKAVKDRVSIADLLVLGLIALGIPILGTLSAAAVIADAKAVYSVDIPPMGLALARTAVLHLMAFALGMGEKLWRALATRYSVPQELLDGALLARKFLRLLVLIIAPITIFCLLLLHWPIQDSILGAYPSRLGILGAIILSLLYLPNLAIHTAAVLMGSEFHFGEAQISLFGTTLVPLPPLPILGFLPASLPTWAPAALILPGLAALFILWRAPRPHWFTALGAALSSAIIFATALWLASGQLGIYSHVGSLLPLSSALAALWIGILSLAAAALTLLQPKPIPEVLESELPEIEEEAEQDTDAPQDPPETTVEESETGDSEPEAEAQECWFDTPDMGEEEEESAPEEPEEPSAH